MKYYIIESAISEFPFRPDDAYLNAVTYKQFCRTCGDMKEPKTAVDVKVISHELPLVVGGFGHPNINFARREFLRAIAPPDGPAWLFGQVIGAADMVIQDVVTYVSTEKRVPIRGTNPLDVSFCEACGSKLFVPFPRSRRLYVVAPEGLRDSLYESNEGSLILSEKALSRIQQPHLKMLKCTPLEVRASSLDGVSDPDLEFWP